MGKKHKLKKRRKKSAAAQSGPPPTSQPPIIVNNGGESPKKKKWWQTGWALLSGIILLAVGVLTYIQLKNEFKSTQEKFTETHIDSGTIKAPQILVNDLQETDTFETESIFTRARTDKFPPVNGIRISEKDTLLGIVFMAGSGMWRVRLSRLKKGVTFVNLTGSQDCYNSKIRLVARDNRLYASAEFRDLQNNNLVGKMDFNRWEVYLDNLLKYKYDDERIEVHDKQGYIIFSLGLFQENQGANGGVVIRGYFQNPKTIMMMNNSKKVEVVLQGTDGKIYPQAEYYKCISKENPNWKKEAEKYIDKIESIF